MSEGLDHLRNLNDPIILPQIRQGGSTILTDFVNHKIWLKEFRFLVNGQFVTPRSRNFGFAIPVASRLR
jgi:hypothetical protein